MTIAPKSSQLAAAVLPRGSVVSCRVDGAGDALGKVGAIGDQDRLRGGIVLGLREEVRGKPVRIVVGVGDDEHFRRPGDHVDSDRAEDEPLRCGDVVAAGADDLGDGRYRCGAVGERRNRLGAADPIDFVDAGKPRGEEHQRIEDAVRRRHSHDDAQNARDLGRNGVHQHRARIGRGAARHIEPDRIDGGPAAAELDPERIGEAVVLWHLAAVECLDPIACDDESFACRRRGRPFGLVDLGARYSEPLRADVEAVETLRVFNQRRVAPGAHVLDDLSRRRLDVLRDLALQGKERREARFKSRIGGIRGGSPSSYAITWRGAYGVDQAGPRSVSSASRTSTERRIAPPPAKSRITSPEGLL